MKLAVAYSEITELWSWLELRSDSNMDKPDKTEAASGKQKTWPEQNAGYCATIVTAKPEIHYRENDHPNKLQNCKKVNRQIQEVNIGVVSVLHA